MKRVLALMLTAVMLLAALPAAAATLDYTLEEKLERQLAAGSGFRGEIAFTATGDALASLDAATFASLKLALSVIKVPVTYIRTTGASAATVAQATLSAGGSETPLLQLVERGDIYTLQSALLSGSAIAFEKDSGVLERALSQSDSEWPALLPALLRLYSADEAYKTRLETALSPYLTKLGLFVQGYTKVQVVQGDGKTLTASTVVIPAAAFIAQTKQTLVDVYADDALLALLAERFTARETAAYLQPGMLPTFLATLDSLALSGDIAIKRDFDAQGTLVLSDVTFPFAEGQALRALSVRQTTGEDGATLTTVSGELKKQYETSQNGALFEISARSDAGDPGETLLSGEATLTREPSPDEGFQVGDAQTAQAPLRAGYSLYINDGAETFDSVADLCARQREITLVLKPLEGDTWNALSLSCKLAMQSGSAKRAAISMTGELSLSDLQTGATLRANLTGRTAAPWTVVASEAANAARIDLMDAQSLKTYLDQLLTTLKTTLTALPATLLQVPQG